MMKIIPPIGRQTIFLWGIDTISNLADYGFHFYIAKKLNSGDFAIVQTVNSILVIFTTIFAVLQPVVARFVAEETNPWLPTSILGRHTRSNASGIFQWAIRIATLTGILFTTITISTSRPLSVWLNIPQFAIISLAIMLTLTLWRPVVTGILQGEQRFLAYGIVRLAQACGRLFGGILLISLGASVVGAIIALPLGIAIAILTGLFILGAYIWRTPDAVAPDLLSRGLRLSISALLAFAAYMSLTNLDLIWINRFFPPDTAGGYATAVVLRRVLAVFPGAVLVILYPRIITRIKANRPITPVISLAGLAVGGSTVLLTCIYVLFGPEIIGITFGRGYIAIAAPLLGSMGVAMTGYGLGSIWLNLFLATHPTPFVGLLVVTALSQCILLAFFHTTILEIVLIFLAGGWVLAIGGFALYLLWLRPQLNKEL